MTTTNLTSDIPAMGFHCEGAYGTEQVPRHDPEPRPAYLHHGVRAGVDLLHGDHQDVGRTAMSTMVHILFQSIFIEI